MISAPLIAVSGSHSGVGKTLLVEKLLRRLEGWSAIKVTTIKEGPCPRKVACGACKGQKAAFTIVSDARAINQKGKDTARMKKAGAKKVLWLKAKPEGLKDGLEAAFKKLKNTNGIIIEGTSVLKFIKPDLNVHLDKKLSTRHCKARSAEVVGVGFIRPKKGLINQTPTTHDE